MRALGEEEIRAAFAHLPADDVARIPLPGLHETVWEEREFLGWLDPAFPARGYLVHDGGTGAEAPDGAGGGVAGGAVGIVLRRADRRSGPGVPAMCSMCRATQPATQVSLWSAARPDHSSIGTYLCDDLGCSRIIRMLPESSPWAIGSGDLLAGRIAGLAERVRAFTATVLAGR